MGALQFVEPGFLQGEIVLRFGNPIFGSRTSEALGLISILITFPGLEQEGASFRLGDFL
jgi:hypothetical protein